MERLTQKVEALGDVWLLENGKTKEMVTESNEYKKYFEKLAELEELEELEEQRLLLHLPCKLGDDFYWISDEEPEHGIKSEVKICGKIKGIAVMEDGFYIIDEDGDMNKVGSRYALLTREDAEKKLEEMED